MNMFWLVLTSSNKAGFSESFHIPFQKENFLIEHFLPKPKIKTTLSPLGETAATGKPYSTKLMRAHKTHMQQSTFSFYS